MRLHALSGTASPSALRSSRASRNGPQPVRPGRECDTSTCVQVLEPEQAVPEDGVDGPCSSRSRLTTDATSRTVRPTHVHRTPAFG